MPRPQHCSVDWLLYQSQWELTKLMSQIYCHSSRYRIVSALRSCKFPPHVLQRKSKRFSPPVKWHALIVNMTIRNEEMRRIGFPFLITLAYRPLSIWWLNSQVRIDDCVDRILGETTNGQRKVIWEWRNYIWAEHCMGWFTSHTCSEAIYVIVTLTLCWHKKTIHSSMKLSHF